MNRALTTATAMALAALMLLPLTVDLADTNHNGHCHLVKHVAGKHFRAVVLELVCDKS